MKNKIWILSLVWLALLLVLAASAPSPGLAAESPVNFVDPDTLKGMLGDPSLLLIDVRHQGEWGRSKIKLKGAMRFSPAGVASWGPLLPKDRKIVLY